jgi:hypothetical protein
VLEDAAAAGELADGSDPDDLAWFLVTLLQGVMVLGRALGESERLERIVDCGLSLLHAPNGPPPAAARETPG